ncbi:MAG: hypothetical protein ACP5QT_05145, partial [Brevinematia bacterium]
IIQLPKVLSEDEWVRELLLQKDCLVYPGYFYDFENEAYIVLSLIVEENILKEGIGKIFELFDEKNGIF